MTTVRLTGWLRCRNDRDRALVEALLPDHIARTRAERGCISFDVTPTVDPLVWAVSEQFRDAAAFRAHQARTATSEWGERTSGIPREYTTTSEAASCDE